MTHSPDPSSLIDEEDQTAVSEGDLFVFPTSFGQQQLWLLDELESGSAYNLHSAWRLTGQINLSALEKALNEIVRRHEALRTTFRFIGGRPFQVIAENNSVAVKGPSEYRFESQKQLNRSVLISPDENVGADN